MLSLTLALLLNAVRVDGTATCPEPAQVQTQLDAQPQSRRPGRLHEVQLVSTATGVELVGFDADGVRLDGRAIPTTASCADRAHAVAVVIAAWDSELAIDRARPQPSSASIGPAQPPVRMSRGDGPGPSTSARLPAVGIGLGAVMSGRTIAPSACGSVAFAEQGNMGLRLSLGSQLAYRQAIGAGWANWSRHVAGVGVATRAREGLEFAAEAVFALVTASGSGYSEAKSDTDFDKGISIAVRYVAPIGGWQPWLELSTRAWLGQESIRGGSQVERLSPFEFGLRIGTTLGG